MASTTATPTTPPRRSWQFGRIYAPDEAWLAMAAPEPILEPELPIVDPHHRRWDRPGWRYLLDELLADTSSGHNIIATVFVQARAMHRATGPAELRPVGETEFVNGVAAIIAARNGRSRLLEGPLPSNRGDYHDPKLNIYRHDMDKAKTALAAKTPRSLIAISTARTTVPTGRERALALVQ